MASKFITNPVTQEKLPVGSIFCIGRNYANHAKELNNPIPKEPLVFLKPKGTLAYDGDELTLPNHIGPIQNEVEVILLIGKECKNLSEDNALDALSGIGIGLDLTARDLQSELAQKGKPWTLAKGWDDFAPISEFIPLSEIDDINNVTFSLTVNDEVRQKDSSKSMLFSIPKILTYLSSWATLYPGDLVFTGTPQGVAAINPGDQLFAELNDKKTTLNVSVRQA